MSNVLLSVRIWRMNPIIIGGVVLASVLSIFGVSKTEKRQALISPIVYVIPTTLPTPLPTEITPTASPTAIVALKKIKPTATPKPTPTAEAPERVNNLIDRYRIVFGLDPNVFRHLLLCESGQKSNATNGKYVGLFQFDKQTWVNMRKEMGQETDPDLRYSAEESIKTTAYALSKGRKKLWPNCVP